MNRAALLSVSAAFALFTIPAIAEDLPVTIAADSVAGDPEVDTRDFKGHTAWSLTWYRDAEGRAMQIGFVEGLKLPYRDRPVEMLKFMHDEGSTDEAELRSLSSGRAERIWDLDVFWLIASERAVMEPDPDKPETIEGGRLHRGEARRNCAVFTAYTPKGGATLIGSYCRELPPDSKIDEAIARQWLQALDLKIVE